MESIYKVRFLIHKRGYRNIRLDGLYVSSKRMSVPSMKRDASDFIKAKLSAYDSLFETFQIDLIEFKKLKTDFICGLIRQENPPLSCDGTTV